MNEADLARIEQEVGVRLPPAYREFLKAPPARLAKFIASMAEEESEFAVPVFLTVEPLIGQNVAVRNPDDRRYDDLAFEFAADPNVRWPAEHFIIGTDGHGNYYSIKHEEENTRVYFWEHYCEFEVHSKSLTDFAKKIPRASTKTCRVLTKMVCKLHSVPFRKEGDAHVDACVFPFIGAIRSGVQDG